MRYKRRVLFSLVLLLFAFGIWHQLKFVPVQQKSLEWSMREKQIEDIEIDKVNTEIKARMESRGKEPKTKLILIYTTIFREKIWHGLHGTKQLTHFKDIGCPNNCQITYDKERIKDADAVLFYSIDVEEQRYENHRYNAKILEADRQRAPKSQKWIFVSHENPKNDLSMYTPYKQFFNWTATFSERADIFIPYTSFKKSNQVNIKTKNYAKGKTGLVAWAVSNCRGIRLDYALELQNYLPITVYGRCRDKFKKQGECKDHFSEKCQKEMSGYKFYLAFENDFCQDYVTEKYWERIYQESIPIVMGANYDERLVIPGSFIDTDKFESIKALADYLHYLDSNDTAYNEYFSWKKHYVIDSSPSADMHCKICMEIHSKKSQQTSIMTLSEVYNWKKTCGIPFGWKRDKVVKLVEQSRKSRD